MNDKTTASLFENSGVLVLVVPAFSPPSKKQADSPSIKISSSSHVRVFILLPRDSELD